VLQGYELHSAAGDQIPQSGEACRQWGERGMLGTMEKLKAELKALWTDHKVAVLAIFALGWVAAHLI
jgi:hypothetical protein